MHAIENGISAGIHIRRCIVGLFTLVIEFRNFPLDNNSRPAELTGYTVCSSL